MIGQVGVDHRRDERRRPSAPWPHADIHCGRARHNAEHKDGLNGLCVAKVQKVEQQRGQKVAQGAVDVEERVAVAKGKVGAPARPPDAVGHHTVKLVEEVYVVARIVGAPEVAGQQKGGHGKDGEQQGQPKERVAPKRRVGRDDRLAQGLRRQHSRISGHRAPTCRQGRHWRAGACHPASCTSPRSR